MRNLARGATVALLLLTTTTGCKWSWTSWPWAPPLPSSKALINSYPIPRQMDCLNNDKKIDTVHIKITNVDELDLHSSGMSYYKSDDHGNVHVDPRLTPEPTRMQNYETYVDFEGASYLPNKHSVALIELEMADRRYTFMHGTNSAVITSDAANGYMFCIKQDMEVPRGARVVSFYVRWVDKKHGLPVIGAYNFLLENSKGERRFLSVDPEVQNEG